MTDHTLQQLLADRVNAIRARIAAACSRVGRSASEVTLVAVTKTVSSRVAGLLPAIGCSDLGESRPQVLWKKAAEIRGVRWHLVGHLQRNKLDRTVPLCSLLHSVDSERLLTAVSDFGVKRGAVVPVLLEVNCSREGAKGGFDPSGLPKVADGLGALHGVRVDGLMTMAANAEDPQTARPTFAELRALREAVRTRTRMPLPHLSMGMSGDFEVAVEEGATMVRVGTTLFEGLEGA